MGYFFVYSTLVAMAEPVRMYPEVRPSKKVAVIEQRTQQRITIVEERWQQQEKIQQKPQPSVRKVEDDWFILLDVAPKKSGIVKVIRIFKKICYTMHNNSATLDSQSPT